MRGTVPIRGDTVETPIADEHCVRAPVDGFGKGKDRVETPVFTGVLNSVPESMLTKGFQGTVKLFVT